MLRRPPLRHVCLVLVIVVVTGLPSLFAEGSHALTAGNPRFKAALPLIATCSPPCVEKFDSVAIPNLPTGWTASVPTGQPGDVPWRTVNTTRVSFPNSAFAGGPDHVSDNWLTSKTFAMVSSSAILTFDRKSQLETRFDGMVLEISMDGGPFVDIITAGGSFIAEGYNATIVVSSSPITGRFAWTGDTGGNFVTSSVRLPTSANPRSVTFRWRVATDHSVASVGAFIDNVTLTEPPPNDNFANAQPIDGISGVISGTNVGATKELPLEQPHAGNAGGASVWYRWQAPSTGRFVFTTFGSDFNTLLAVYTGDALPGIHMESNDDDLMRCLFEQRFSRLAFSAVAGTIYHIAVDRHSNYPSGNIVLRWGRSATIRGAVTTASGEGHGATVVRLEGDTCLNGAGSLNFPDIPTGGSYNVIVQDPGIFYVQWPTNASISPLTGDVLNFNFYLWSPTGNIAGFIDIQNSTFSDVRVTCACGPPASISKTVTPTATGAFECTSLPIYAQYVVTPSKLGFSFSPINRTVTFETSQGISIAPFTGTPAPPRTISGQVTHPNGTTGVSGVSVALSGSQTASTLTDANGNYSFSGVLYGGNYTVTPSKTNYTFTPPSLTFNNLTIDKTANFTATSLLYLLLEESGTVVNQVVALDSMLLVRDPFPIINSANLLNRVVDPNTRIIIFVSNFELGPTEPPSSVVINLIGSNNQTYDIPAEDVRPVPNFGFTQLVFRLPDTLSAGTCTLAVKARGLISNPGTIRITN